MPTAEPDPDFAIPPDINGRLHRAQLVPLMDEFRRFGRGAPGITVEREGYWILRDARGSVIGGVKAFDLGDGLISLDVEVDPAHRRRGHATRLYEAVAASGIDVEAGSDLSLRTGLLTPLGYAFQVGRRKRKATPKPDDTTA